YELFAKELERCKRDETPVVVMPAMDRYFGVFAQDVDLAGLHVVAALDSRAHRLGAKFLGKTVAPLDVAHVRAHADAKFLILPWVEYDRALAVLHESGIAARSIVCWNALFAHELHPLAPQRKSA